MYVHVLCVSELVAPNSKKSSDFRTSALLEPKYLKKVNTKVLN